MSGLALLTLIYLASVLCTLSGLFMGLRAADDMRLGLKALAAREMLQCLVSLSGAAAGLWLICVAVGGWC